MEKEKNVRTRNWVFIMYPDSMPDNDFDKSVSILSEFFIPFAVSPLHDRDFNADGTPKKPHYHVLITADGNKSYKQIKEMSDSVHGCDCKPCGSAGGYYRYFCHLDNPEKAQYKEVDIRHFCGFDPSQYNKPTSTQRYLAIKDMIAYIEKNNIIEYCVFVSKAIEVNFDWFKLLADNSSYLITEYIKSRRNKSRFISAEEHKKICSSLKAQYEEDLKRVIEDNEL